MKDFLVTSGEVAMMIHLVAKLEAEDFKHNEAKALIHKCKAEVETPSRFLRVVQ